MRSNEKHKYHTVLTVPNSKRKIVERGKMDTPNTLLSLSCVGKGCSITGGAGKLVVLAQEEEFEVTKGVIRIRNSKKDIQHYGQNKKDHDLQNNTHKSKDRVTRTTPKPGDALRCSGRVSTSCSTSGTHFVTLVTNPMISYE